MQLYAPEESEFKEVVDATPRVLIRRGLYRRRTIEWRDGLYRTVSLRLAARALGAQMGGGCFEWAGRRTSKGLARAHRAWRARLAALTGRLLSGRSARARIGEDADGGWLLLSVRSVGTSAAPSNSVDVSIGTSPARSTVPSALPSALPSRRPSAKSGKSIDSPPKASAPAVEVQMQTHPAVAPVEARPEPSATEEPVATHAPSPSAEAAVLPACGVSTAPGVRLPSGTHNQLTYNRLGPHGKVSTSAQPTLAPADYASLQPMVKVCMEWDEQTSHGSGELLDSWNATCCVLCEMPSFYAHPSAGHAH